MQRRDFVELMLLTGGSAMTANATPAPAFDVTEKTVAQLQAAMVSGRTTAQQLVRLYLARIASLDKEGPRLNSII